MIFPEERQRIIDEEHLRLLTLCHWIQGGVLALFSLFPIIHLVMGLMILNGKFPPGANAAHQPEEVPRFVGGIFVAFATFCICAGMTYAALAVISARSLSRRRNRTFSLVIAGLNCLLAPFGTVLGVFTLLVLSRPSVAVLYQNHDRSLKDGPSGRENPAQG